MKIMIIEHLNTADSQLHFSPTPAFHTKSFRASKASKSLSLTPCFSKVRQPLTATSTVSTVSLPPSALPNRKFLKTPEISLYFTF
jgi:hypothetical protein